MLKDNCSQGTSHVETEMRQHWMAVLARSSTEDLEEAWQNLERKPRYHFLRSAETGLAMVQARMGGTGQLFNLGEMTITRCTVKTEPGYVGHAYVAGRRPRLAELAAVLDAILQDDTHRDNLLKTAIHPLREEQEQRSNSAALKTAATKVDFFTMVRGDD